MKQVTKFIRLDKQIVDRGLVSTIQRAQELIMNGAVRVNGAVITAAHCPVNDDHKIEISGIDCPWVSPEALKLFETLENLKIDVKGKCAIDLGAGIGGFTDVLLQKNIKKVYAVDKDAALLHPSLSLNPRVKNLQRINAKDLQETHIEDKIDLIVAELPDEDLASTVAQALNIAEAPFDVLIFMADKKAAKDAEKFLRLENSCLIKKVPDVLQKNLEEKGSSLIWAIKKA